uniref:AAA family ATPase n=1 Tax=Cellvibrio fontiphilus TaxID=1815559 RepID=UPI002B4C0484|nr:AAA family ATPase [Cellvibrio fontiphilus]
MTGHPPLRAQPDSRLVDQPAGQQGYLFDVPDSEADEQLLADYRQRYGLSEDPFAQDYSFPLFTGAGRRQLLDQLLHLCQFSNSLLVVLGDVGVGKTRTAHAFMDSLSDHDQICFLSLQSNQSLEQVLTAITQTFGINTGPLPSAENLLSAIEAFIAEEAQVEDEGLAVVVVDNAQLLDDQTLAVLSALLNNFPQQNRLHLAFFAEPSFLRRLERISPESLLINDFHLQPFTLAETVDYLNFRMEMADYLGPEIFTESMVDPWWRQAQGHLGILHESAQERLLESVTPKLTFDKRSLPVAHIVAIALLIAVVGTAFLYMGEDDNPAPPVAVMPPQVPATGQAATSSSLELTSTQTPVQPLLQTLPQPQQPNQIAATQQPVESSQAPQVTGESDTGFAREEVVPLAQLPTVPAKKVEPVAQVPASNAAQSTAASASVVAEPAPKPEPKPVVVEQPVPKAIPDRKPLATTASSQERNILAWSPSEYTVQLLGVSNRKAALDYMAAQPNKGELLMFKSKRQGNDWFVVITGRFSSSAEARQAIARLPASQRDAGPWPRDVKAIQSEIKSAL